MKNFQKKYPDGLCVILSSENRDNKLYAEKIGVNTENVIIIKSKFVDDLFFRFQILIDETEAIWKEEKLPGKPKIYAFWDSIGSTLARGELSTFKENVAISRKNAEKGTATEFKHVKMADFAKSAKSSVKSILAQLYEKDIIFICLNHLIADFNTGGYNSTGGGWIEYIPYARIRTIFKEWIRLDDVEVAQTGIIKVEKNDFGSRKKTEFTILLGEGIVLSSEDIEYGVEKGIIKKESATKYSFLKMSWNSPRTFFKLYKDKNKFLSILHQKITSERHKDVLSEKELE
jgi:hypothetical protein